jgi:hypothetical protein
MDWPTAVGFKYFSITGCGIDIILSLNIQQECIHSLIVVEKRNFFLQNYYLIKLNTGYFTSDNEPGGIENATHNTSGGKAGYLSPPCPGLRSNV